LPVSKSNTGSLPLRGILPVMIFKYELRFVAFTYGRTFACES